MTACSFLLKFVHLVWYCASSYCQALEHLCQAPFDNCLKFSVKICTSCVGLPATAWCQNTSTQLHLMTDWNFLLKSLHLVVYWTSSYCLAWEHLYTAPFGDWLQFSGKICTSVHLVLCFLLPATWWLQFSVKICTSCIELPATVWHENTSTQFHLVTDCSFLVKSVQLVLNIQLPHGARPPLPSSIWWLTAVFC